MFFRICLLLFILLVACETKKPQKNYVYIEENSLVDHSGQFLVIADSITYNVDIMNTDPEDEWKEKSLSSLNRNEWSKQIMEKIKNGRLIAYDYETNQPINYIDIENKIKEETSDITFSMVQFSEVWAFDSSNMRMYKKVRSAIFGYPNYNSDGEYRGPKAAFKVYFEK